MKTSPVFCISNCKEYHEVLRHLLGQGVESLGFAAVDTDRESRTGIPEVIYAEGIAAETLLVDTRTRPALPKELSEKLAQTLPGHEGRAHLDFEVSEALLDHPDAAELLKRASTR